MMRIFIFVIVFVSVPSLYAQIKAGQIAPEITGVSPSGDTLKLSDLKGKYVLLDFWASWCHYCRIQNPDFVEIYSKYNSKGLEIFSVSFDKEKKDWEKAIKADSLNWQHHVCDFIGIIYSKPAVDYAIYGIPSTFLIDPKGRVLLANPSIDKLEKKIKWIFEDQTFVYPIVTDDSLFFTEKKKYKLFDNAGNELTKGKSDKISIKALPDGEYQVFFDDKYDVVTKISNNQTSVPQYNKVDKTLHLSEKKEIIFYNENGSVCTEINDKFVSINESKLLVNKNKLIFSVDGKLYNILP